jgi:H+/Cl- antiporter ClcA
MRKVIENTKKYFRQFWLYSQALVKWFVMSSIIGFASGLVASLFDIGVNLATEFRSAHPWVIDLLPVGGLAAVGLYKLFRLEGENTNDIITEIQKGRGVKFRLAPAIFLTTILTHLVGGSAGREGAALQMGGAIGYTVGKGLLFDDRDLRTATMAGMAAFFSALFGAPLGATVFSMGVVSVGLLYHAAFLPCFIASMIAYVTSLVIGVKPLRFHFAMPELSAESFLRVAVLALLAALVSVLFCGFIHYTEANFHKHIKNRWILGLAGGTVLLVLTLLIGTRDYNGAGLDVIRRAIEEGETVPAAFLIKIVFTALTLAVGFKGGEVVPSFFVGATFGCFIGPFLGLPAGFAAAVGMICVFCGAVNCPMASMVLAVEFFGAEGMLYYALACGIAYVFSGYTGIYSSQRILYDKLKAQFIDVHTNDYVEGDDTEAKRHFK